MSSKSRLAAKKQEAALQTAKRISGSLRVDSGKIIQSEVLGIVDSWNEERAFGFIKTPEGERFFCHMSGLSSYCEKDELVKFDVWQKSDGEMKAVKVTRLDFTCIEVAKNQFGRVEQLHLVRGVDGKAFQCKAHGFCLRDDVQFEVLWNGRAFRAVNIRKPAPKAQVSMSKPALEAAVGMRKPALVACKPAHEAKAVSGSAPQCEEVDDASTVASLSLDTVAAPLQVAAPKQARTVLPKEDVTPTQQSTPAEANLKSADQLPPPPLAPHPVLPAIGVADEIRKLAELMREGILTDKEFQVQKKKLLGH